MATLDRQTFQAAAAEYAKALSRADIESLFGVTDGKAVGTFVEHQFNAYLSDRFAYEPGNSARGIDFPDLGIDLKVTSTRQPQSSCPFRDATQKVYGLGYDLAVFVYDKTDDQDRQVANLQILHVIYLEKEVTSDFQTTTGLLALIENDANVDDIDAFLDERKLPLDEIGRRSLAERILQEPPHPGCLTISNALQWRLQYGRAIGLAAIGAVGVTDLVAR
ncbi:MAG: restriction endonuclease [Actinomycetota bacterium]